MTAGRPDDPATVLGVSRSMVAHDPSFIELFTPKLVTVLRERHGLADLKADAVAGLTVAMVRFKADPAEALAAARRATSTAD